ncbi:MAG TPA: IS21-like element helper ATPase IstB [Lachnospiraceae bacterium]|nr:IS21-like element helper ATPase IstB [Lachnospiraceae bacterium]
MNYQTAEQLSEMKLHAMRLEYARQQELPASEDLSFDDRLGMIVNAQYNARLKAKTKRLMNAAGLREPTATLSSIDFDPVRKLKKAGIASLSDCEWIKNGSNLIITGATGVGKTYLLSAFGREACIRGYTVKSFRVTRLLTDLAIGRGDGSYNKLMKDLIKPDLLILDDFGMKQLDIGLTQDFLEVVEERYHHQRSIAISAQLPVKEWISVFKDPTIADAVLDRIVRNAYRFDLKGPSRRPTVEHQAADAGDDNPEATEYTNH